MFVILTNCSGNTRQTFDEQHWVNVRRSIFVQIFIRFEHNLTYRYYNFLDFNQTAFFDFQ
jgi:hypothetical protein